MENKKTVKEKNDINMPLFTGDYRRDSAVSEYEKTAEAAQMIFGKLMRLLKK